MSDFVTTVTISMDDYEELQELRKNAGLNRIWLRGTVWDDQAWHNDMLYAGKDESLVLCTQAYKNVCEKYQKYQDNYTYNNHTKLSIAQRVRALFTGKIG